MSEKIIGAAIEDSHISVGLVDFETRKVVRHSVQRLKVDPFGTADQIIAIWAKALKQISEANNLEQVLIGISIPGVCNYETGILSSINGNRYRSLYGNNLKSLIASELGISPSNIRMVNDAACFLQGEIFGGTGRGFKRSLGVTLGMGLGNAKYIDGVVTDTQLYNMPLYDGIAEDYICAKWLIDRYKALTGTEVKDLVELKQCAALDPTVGKVFVEFAESLSVFLAAFIKQYNPEIVVVGGFMETYNRFFFDALTDKLQEKKIKPPVLRAVLGEQASIIGAASTWYEARPLHS